MFNEELRPHNITDVIEYIELYVEEMRRTEDMETIPAHLKQYVWEYFRETKLTKELLETLAMYVVDKSYRVISQITLLDNYTRVFFATIIPFVWDKLQDRGIDIFYILDNELPDDRFQCITELFSLTGMAVVKPSVEGKPLEYSEIEKQLKDYMAPRRMIMYVEKDSSVNYLEEVMKLTKGSGYLRILRNRTPDDSHIFVFDQYPELKKYSLKSGIQKILRIFSPKKSSL